MFAFPTNVCSLPSGDISTSFPVDMSPPVVGSRESQLSSLLLAIGSATGPHISHPLHYGPVPVTSLSSSELLSRSSSIVVTRLNDLEGRLEELGDATGTDKKYLWRLWKCYELVWQDGEASISYFYRFLIRSMHAHWWICSRH